MADYNIRPATAEDVSALVMLKGDYVRCLYKGYLPVETLKKTEGDYYLEQMTGLVEGTEYSIDVLERIGRVIGCIAYGLDASADGAGMICEVACGDACSPMDKRCLVDHCLQAMRDRGLTRAHLWILRDNFRMRFLFESMGFRADGERRNVMMDDREVIVTRYVYPL